MRITFVYPSSPVYTGGVVVLYHYANGLARRGHRVHFVHGPTTPMRISSLDELSWFPFDPAVTHQVVDVLDDPSIPDGDVVFSLEAPARLGQPVILIQGYNLIAAAIERPAFRARCPKLAVATWLHDVGVAWGSPPEQMLYVPMGLDHDVFRVLEPGSERPIDVAVLSHQHPMKGWEDGLAALELVRRRGPHLRVAAFGILDRGEPVPEWVDFHLDPSRQELVGGVLNRAKVFLQPSHLEGFGYSAVEAMACGAALVTTDNGGSRDYAAHDETALVVGRRDVPAMAEAVDALLADDGRRVRLATAGERLVRRFTWEEGAAAMEAHLERYLSDPAALQAPPGDAPMFLEDVL